MKNRDLSTLITQGDKEYAEANWGQFSAVISLNEDGASVGCEYLHRPVKDEDAPSLADIACWVSYALQRMGEGKRVLVNCQAGQNRSLTIGLLILSVFEGRKYQDVLNEWHDKLIRESPPHNWWPYQHWSEAISLWQKVQVEQIPPRCEEFATHPGAILLGEAIRLAGGQRPDYLTSLYRYACMLPKPARIVELGCYKGDSTIVMACAIKGTDSHIITIDPVFQHGGVFVSDAHLKFPGYHESSLVRFLNRVSEAGLDGYISVVPDYSQHVLKRWDCRQIDLFFCDAEHSYEAVCRDCEWLKFVRPGGFAAFDDLIEPVERAITDYLSTHSEWRWLHKSTSAPDGDMVVTLLQRGG